MFTRRALAALMLALAIPFAAQSARAADPLPDVVMGNPDAKVEIVEYASMTCPHCANFHKTTFQELKKEYIDTGKVKFVLREFPFDPLAAAVFMLARCSEDKYYDVIDLFFENQSQWAVREGALPAIQSLALKIIWWATTAKYPILLLGALQSASQCAQYFRASFPASGQSPSTASKQFRASSSVPSVKWPKRACSSRCVPWGGAT